MSETLSVRIDSELKREFTEIVESIGLDVPTVVRMLAKQTVMNKRVPLSLSAKLVDNSDTLDFMEDIKADWGDW